MPPLLSLSCLVFPLHQTALPIYLLCLPLSCAFLDGVALPFSKLFSMPRAPISIQLNASSLCFKEKLPTLSLNFAISTSKWSTAQTPTKWFTWVPLFSLLLFCSCSRSPTTAASMGAVMNRFGGGYCLREQPLKFAFLEADKILHIGNVWQQLNESIYELFFFWEV